MKQKYSAKINSIRFLIGIACCVVFAVLASERVWAIEDRIELPQNMSTSRTSSGRVSDDLKKTTIQSAFEAQQFMFTRSNQNYFGKDEENLSEYSTWGGSWEKNSGSFRFRGRGFFVPQEDEAYFHVPELSFQVERIIAGRHLHTWSVADSYWKNGIWQSRFMWDGFYPEEEGMLGLFLRSESRASTRWMVLASPFFLPDSSADYREVDGKIVSESPWFRTPPRFLEFRGEATPVRASIERPSVEDVLVQPSFAVQGERDISKQQVLRLAYGYKPISQTQLMYEYYLRTTATTTETVVILHPKFPYEHVATIEHDLKNQGWQWTTSLTYQDPQTDKEPEEWISQEIPSKWTASFTAHRDLMPGTGASTHFGLIKVWQETPQDQGENASDESGFERREPYFLALRAGYVSSERRFLGCDWQSELDAIYDIEQEAGLLRQVGRCALNREWKAELHLNTIGVIRERQNPEYDNAFLRTYRANDDVSLKVTYVY
jgi:hypothetical protein